MARETKKERLAREEAEMNARKAELESSYPYRLMNLLERAQTYNFDIRINNGMFIVSDRNNDYAHSSELSLFYNDTNELNLNELSWKVEVKEEAANEAARKAAIKQAALSKLTAEERELLGV